MCLGYRLRGKMTKELTAILALYQRVFFVEKEWEHFGRLRFEAKKETYARITAIVWRKLADFQTTLFDLDRWLAVGSAD